MDVPHYNLSLQDFVCDVEQLIGLETYITGNREKIDAQSVSIFSQITVKTWLLGCKDTVLNSRYITTSPDRYKKHKALKSLVLSLIFGYM